MAFVATARSPAERPLTAQARPHNQASGWA